MKDIITPLTRFRTKSSGIWLINLNQHITKLPTPTLYVPLKN